MPRRRWLPEGVTDYRDRHGKTRYRFRKAGLPPHSFKAAPGTPEFVEEWRRASTAAPLTRTITGTPAKPGSMQALIDRLQRAPGWLNLDPATRAAYHGPLSKFCEAFGEYPVAGVTTQHLDAILGRMADRPGAANNLRKALGRAFTYAVKIGWRKENPVTLTDQFSKGPGFHCWTEEEIAQFCTHWPLGTKPRLALELALNTSARRCDLAQLGRAHIRNGRFEFTHAKRGNSVSVPILPECQAAMDAMPVAGIETLLVTQHGKPFSVAGLGNWFREACSAAGLPHCALHGLRKAMSRRIAESGSNALQGRAITGQTQDETFAYYARSASRTKMADAALANLAAMDLANRDKTK